MNQQHVYQLYSLETESAAPSYTLLPQANEQTIDYNPRLSPTPLGTVIRRWKHLSLTLNSQCVDEPDSLPTYGRNSVIDGEIELSSDEAIRSVSVQLDGRLDMSISDGGSTELTVAAENCTLWDQSDPTSPQRCPAVLPFTIPFPSTYENNEREYKVPPSYEAIFYGIPALCVKCTYTLCVTIVKRPAKMGFWKPNKTYSIALNYRPRTRPSRPIQPILGPLFSTIKPAPEEWHQIVTQIHSRLSTGLEPIQCHFLIPSVQTFGLRDTIPFHIQLTAPASSLRHFLEPNALEGCPLHAARNHASKRSAQKKRAAPPLPTLRVFIARQILVEINQRKSWRNSTLGEGTVRPIPACTCHDRSSGRSDASEVTADWEGDVRCREDVNSVGFNVGNVIVKDFIVLHLTPPNPRMSPLNQLQHAHPIKLVTDTWADAERLLHPQDTPVVS